VINSRKIYASLHYEECLLRLYQDVLCDVVRAPKEFRDLVVAEADELRRDLKFALN
jgi:hypothetical protein